MNSGFLLVILLVTLVSMVCSTHKTTNSLSISENFTYCNNTNCNNNFPSHLQLYSNNNSQPFTFYDQHHLEAFSSNPLQFFQFSLYQLILIQYRSHKLQFFQSSSNQLQLFQNSLQQLNFFQQSFHQLKFSQNSCNQLLFLQLSFRKLLIFQRNLQQINFLQEMSQFIPSSIYRRMGNTRGRGGRRPEVNSSTSSSDNPRTKKTRTMSLEEAQEEKKESTEHDESILMDTVFNDALAVLNIANISHHAIQECIAQIEIQVPSMAEPCEIQSILGEHLQLTEECYRELADLRERLPVTLAMSYYNNWSTLLDDTDLTNAQLRTYCVYISVYRSEFLASITAMHEKEFQNLLRLLDRTELTPQAVARKLRHFYDDQTNLRFEQFTELLQRSLPPLPDDYIKLIMVQWTDITEANCAIGELMIPETQELERTLPTVPLVPQEDFLKTAERQNDPENPILSEHVPMAILYNTPNATVKARRVAHDTLRLNRVPYDVR